jgi:hypothetical protein
MKAKSTVPKDKKPGALELEKPRKEIKEFPDPVMIEQDIPDDLPPITQREISDYQLLRRNYKIAKAEFERKHADLVFKLLTHHPVEEPYDVWNRIIQLDDEGRLVVYEPCDYCNSSKIDLTRD